MSRPALIIIIVAALSLLLNGGCADDLRSGSVFSAGAGDAVISFSVENVSLTRAEVGQDMETRIDHAYLLFYPADAAVQTAKPLAAVRAEVSETNTSSLIFKMPLLLEPDTDYQLVAIANADFYVPDGYGNFAVYLDSWCRDSATDAIGLHLFRADRILAENSDCLPMSGGVSNEDPFRFSMQNGIYNVAASLSFRRTVARIDVANLVQEGFKVEGVSLCNWRDAVSAVADQSSIGNRIGRVCGILTDEEEVSGDEIFTEMPEAGEDGIQQLKESIYCFPSVTYDSYPSDHESTALIIKAKYGDDTESSYYRVNVGLTGNKSEIKANVKYLVAIQSVKGRGAATAEEAYAAEESPLVLSIVKDWDLEGSFAMDDNGNFIVLSSGRVDFAGDAVASKELRVLTSRGTTWSMQYTADNDDSADAFIVSALNESSIAVSTTGKNTGESVLSGRLVVTAHTPQGGFLNVDVVLAQNPAADQPDEPVIPDNIPFALVPTSYERVKIKYGETENTIEIDGFDPTCFNSFIDIPFTVYFKDSSLSSVNISTTLQWPLEGRISLDRSSQYVYCKKSFDAFGTGQVQDSDGKEFEYNELHDSSVIVREDLDVINISVGAMGPDDPEIIRNITLYSKGQEVSYVLKIKPRKVIIEDVILIDSENVWFIMDRNIQSLTNNNYLMYVSRDTEGRKRQAYNYCDQSYVTIPFKYRSEGISFSENQHEMYRGDLVTQGQKNNMTNRRKDWLSRYQSTNSQASDPTFYDSDNINKWIYPTKEVVQLCGERMKISKMRMFLLSDVPAMEGDEIIPICCYWSYLGAGPDINAWPRYGYFIQYGNTELTPQSILFLYIVGSRVNTYDWNVDKSDYGLSRLVRPLTSDELKLYKDNYLGYGSEPHKLTICHPDTYESTSLGWLPY